MCVCYILIGCVVFGGHISACRTINQLLSKISEAKHEGAGEKQTTAPGELKVLLSERTYRGGFRGGRGEGGPDPPPPFL